MQGEGAGAGAGTRAKEGTCDGQRLLAAGETAWGSPAGISTELGCFCAQSQQGWGRGAQSELVSRGWAVNPQERGSGTGRQGLPHNIFSSYKTKIFPLPGNSWITFLAAPWSSGAAQALPGGRGS